MNLNHIMTYTSNMERSVSFYQKFGLELIVKSTPNFARFVCPDGDSTFSLHYSEAPVPTGSTTIYFEVDDVDSSVERLKNIGLEGISEPEDKPWHWRESELSDPDGHKLVLFHAGKQRKYPPWRLPSDK